jgi:hypothetical protein
MTHVSTKHALNNRTKVLYFCFIIKKCDQKKQLVGLFKEKQHLLLSGVISRPKLTHIHTPKRI